MYKYTYFFCFVFIIFFANIIGHLIRQQQQLKKKKANIGETSRANISCAE